MKRTRAVAAIAVLAWGVTQLPWPGPGPAQAAIFAVTASGTRFSPSSLAVQVGDTVSWSNPGESHNVTADDGSFASATGFTSFERLFTAPGTFGYRCTIHAALGMTASVTVLAPGQTTTSSSAPQGPVVPPGGSVFIPLPATRVFDTRPGEPTPTPKGIVGPGGTLDVRVVVGTAGVPATGVGAVVLNLTATETTQAGFVTAWPSDLARPLASVLNVGANDTKANLAIVPIGADGTISIFMLGGGHVLGDVVGTITDASAAASITGMFVPTVPFRAFDTRPTESTPGFKGFVLAGASIDTQIAGVGFLPQTGVAAVVMNLTAADAAGPGFVTAWPAGLVRPLASTLNLTAAGETRANAALLALGNGGVSVFTQGGAHLLGDVTGYFAA